MKRLFITMICLLMTGCAFHARSKSMMATELYQVYFVPEKPYSELSTQLKNLFNSLGIKLVKNKSQAPFSIVVSNDLFSYSRPDIVDASLPTTLNFSQTAFVEIHNNQSHKIVASREFNTDESLTLNANQIYTSDANSLIREKLNRRILSLIYYWLISSQTKESICKSH